MEALDLGLVSVHRAGQRSGLSLRHCPLDLGVETEPKELTKSCRELEENRGSRELWKPRRVSIKRC